MAGTTKDDYLERYRTDPTFTEWRNSHPEGYSGSLADKVAAYRAYVEQKGSERIAEAQWRRDHAAGQHRNPDIAREEARARGARDVHRALGRATDFRENIQPVINALKQIAEPAAADAAETDVTAAPATGHLRLVPSPRAAESHATSLHTSGLRIKALPGRDTYNPGPSQRAAELVIAAGTTQDKVLQVADRISGKQVQFQAFLKVIQDMPEDELRSMIHPDFFEDYHASWKESECIPAVKAMAAAFAAWPQPLGSITVRQLRLAESVSALSGMAAGSEQKLGGDASRFGKFFYLMNEKMLAGYIHKHPDCGLLEDEARQTLRSAQLIAEDMHALTGALSRHLQTVTAIANEKVRK